MRESFKRSQELLDLDAPKQKDSDISMERVVTVEEFEKLITEGWQYIGMLPNGKILIKNRQGSDPL